MTSAEAARLLAPAAACSHAVAGSGQAQPCASCGRIERFKAQGRGQAGSIIVSVFGDGILTRGGCVWLGSLIELLAPLGLSERLVRTAVFRLAQDDWLEAVVQGRRSDYRLTPVGRRRFVQASGQIYASASPPWDQRWRLITVTAALEPSARERLRRALFWHGFGELGGDCFVHPSADLALVFESLQADGLAPLLGRLLPLVAANPQLSESGKDADLVRRVDSYAPVLAQWQSHFGAMDEACAFLIRSLLIHDYRRLLLRDPQLPGVLLPAQWAGHEARQLCRQLYGVLLAPSERHLDQQVRLADGQTPLASALLGERFGLRDPLAGGV